MSDEVGQSAAAFSRDFALAALGPEGARVRIEAGPAERAAIAERLGLPSLVRLAGEFALTPFRGGIDLRLSIDAEAQRQCVVSLEAMSETIRDEIRMRFERGVDPDELDDSIDDGVMREPLEGDAIDLGELLVQQLSLSLDPYPRKTGADPLLGKYRDATSPSPFAVLKGAVDRER